MKNPIVIGLIALIVGTGGGFYSGMKFQQSKTPTFARRGNFTGRQGGSRNGFIPINGQIISADSNSITVSMQDGSQKNVFVTSTTQINKASAGTMADLTTGQRVAVFGITNPDGSITAQNIQIRPVQRPFGTPNQGP